MKQFLLTIVCLATSICYAQTIKKIDDFSRIKIKTEASVEIVKSIKNEVVFNVDENLLENFTVECTNNTLTVEQHSGQNLSGLKIRIYTNDVDAIYIQGNSEATLNKFTYQNSLVVMLKEGASLNTGEMNIKNLKVIRSTDSKVIHANAQNISETIDGVLVVEN